VMPLAPWTLMSKPSLQKRAMMGSCPVCAARPKGVQPMASILTGSAPWIVYHERPFNLPNSSLKRPNSYLLHLFQQHGHPAHIPSAASLVQRLLQ